MEQNKDQSSATVRGEAVAEDLLQAAKDFYNVTMAQPKLRMSSTYKEVTDTAITASARLRDAILSANVSARAADALDSQPTDSNRLTKAEREADLACETCHGTGEMCVGTSRQESDGNGPVMEPCAECGYGNDEPTARESLIACLDDDAAMLLNMNPDDEMALTMRQAAAMLQRDGERFASSQPTDGGVRNG